MAGILLAHSQGKGAFELTYQLGEITAGLTGIYPYVSYVRPSWNAWVSLGAGRGQMEISGMETEKDLYTQFGAFGIQGVLSSSDRVALGYHGDVLMSDADIDDQDMVVSVSRARVGLEAKVPITEKVRAYVEVNVRRDGGDAETGTGLEIGGGMQVSHPAWMVKGNIHAHRLVMHTATGFSEWGISGYLQIGDQSDGMMVRVRPMLGRGYGLSVYNQPSVSDVSPLSGNSKRTQVEVGYGVPWKAGAVQSIAGITRLQQGSLYRLGGELRLFNQLAISVFGLTHGPTKDVGISVGASLFNIAG